MATPPMQEGSQGAAPEPGEGSPAEETKDQGEGAADPAQVQKLIESVGNGLQTLIGALGQMGVPPEAHKALDDLLQQYAQIVSGLSQGAPAGPPAGTGTGTPEASGMRPAKPMSPAG